MCAHNFRCDGKVQNAMHACAMVVHKKCTNNGYTWKVHGWWLCGKSVWAMAMHEKCTCDGWTCEECSSDGYANHWWQKKFGIEIVYRLSCVCDSLPFMIEAKS